jgi:hypothetical protein
MELGQQIGRPRASSEVKPQRARSVETGALSHYFAKPLLGLGPLFFAAAVVGALYAGWRFREEQYITAESGVGYWLGIVGSLMMLMLLLYPLRKRYRSLRWLGRVPTWFRSHMLLGIVGPALILFHANFHVGSLNSSVALFFMLVIVASGIVGRYLYTKIHKGLYGGKAEIRGMLSDAESVKAVLGGDFQGAERVQAELAAFERRALSSHPGFLSSLWAFIALGWQAKDARGKALAQAKWAIGREAKAKGLGWWARRKRMNLVREHLDLYFATVNKVARFGVYDRIFAAWHVLHMPLFFLLVLSTVVHVIAVHLY